MTHDPGSRRPAPPDAAATSAPGQRAARRTITAIRLTPVGLLAAGLAAGVAASLMGLPILVVGGDYPASAAQGYVLIAVACTVGFAAPVMALLFSIEALRAGHPRGARLVAAAGTLLLLLAGFVIVVSRG